MARCRSRASSTKPTGALLEKVEAGFETAGALYDACKFRAALGGVPALAREANSYLDRKAPWFQIQNSTIDGGDKRVRHPAGRRQPGADPQTPILPHTAQPLHGYLGYDGQL